MTAWKIWGTFFDHEIVPTCEPHRKSPSGICGERCITFMLGMWNRKIVCEKLSSSKME